MGRCGTVVCFCFFVVDLARTCARQTILTLGMLGAMFLFMPMASYGSRSAVLSWMPSPDAHVVGYNVYYGTASGHYTQFMPAGTATAVTIHGLMEGTTYYFAVTAYNGAGLESAPSDEVFYGVPAIILSLGKIQAAGFSGLFSIQSGKSTFSQWTLEASKDLKTWRTLTVGTNSSANAVVVVSSSPNLFLRLNSGIPGVHLSLSKNPLNGFPNSFFVTATGPASWQWTLEASTDLKTWSPLTRGTNSPVNAAVVASAAPSLFFRLKGQ